MTSDKEPNNTVHKTTYLQLQNLAKWPYNTRFVKKRQFNLLLAL